MIVRKSKSPIAASIASSATQRTATSDGVAAVSERLGMTNCGAGPAFGPTANVNAPRTGCPSTEMTRQTTRYQPSGSSCTGNWSSWLAVVRKRAVWVQASADLASGEVFIWHCKIREFCACRNLLTPQPAHP